MLADTHRPGEIDKSHQRMPDKIVTNLGGITGDDVDHPGRKHLGDFLKRHAGCENGQLRRLHDHCIAGHQCLRQLGAEDRQRPVPGNDQCRHTARLAGDDGIEGRAVLDLVACQPVGIGRCCPEPVTKARNLEMGFLDRFSVLAAEQPCPLIDIVLAGFKIVRHLVQLCGALGIACSRPCGIGGMRGTHRCIDINGGRQGRVTYQLVGTCRIIQGIGPATFGRACHTVDIIARGDGCVTTGCAQHGSLPVCHRLRTSRPLEACDRHRQHRSSRPRS